MATTTIDTIEGMASRGISVFTGSSIICLYFSSSVNARLIRFLPLSLLYFNLRSSSVRSTLVFRRISPHSTSCEEIFFYDRISICYEGFKVRYIILRAN
jgi:hypothetical protein